jgi:hypothetical protein
LRPAPVTIATWSLSFILSIPLSYLAGAADSLRSRHDRGTVLDPQLTDNDLIQFVNILVSRDRVANARAAV